MSNKILGILFFILAIKIIILKDWSGNWIKYNFSTYYLYIPLGGLCIYVGILFFKHTKTKHPSYSKCPQCKTAYDYQKLNKGMCPKCHIPTIDMEEYFKHFPDELKDEKESNETKR